MKPEKFSALVTKYGESEKYSVGQVFHAQNFPQKIFLIKKGYVKRYQATNPEEKVLELIYGPDHIVSLSQLYKTLFGVDQNQNEFIYVYQAMTDVEVRSIDANLVLQELEKDPGLYKDFFYESGIKLRSNIFRLASNSIKDDYKKIAHLLVNLAYEFGPITEGSTEKTIALPLPLKPIDLAEQLNISKEVVAAVLQSLCSSNIISREDDTITILNLDLLKDVYL
jgi:CRP-like cAMP-binding protein